MSNDQRKPPKKKIIVVNDGVDNMTDDKSPADFQDAEKKTVIEVRSWTERPDYLLQDEKTIESYKEQLNKAWTKAINSLDEPENWQQSVFDISKIVNSIAEVIRNSPYGDIEEFFSEYDELRPFVSEELKKHPDLKHLNADSFLGELEMYDVFGDDPDNELTQVLKAARREKARQDNINRQKENQAEYSRVTYKKGDGVKYPVDKLFRDVFSLRGEEAVERGRFKTVPEEVTETGIELKYEPKGSKKKIRLHYDYFIEDANLKKFGIDQKLPEPYDAFVCVALDNLLAEGNDEPTLTKIWHELGNSGSPNSKQIKELFKSLIIGDSTKIIADSRQVYDEFVKGEVKGSISIRRLMDIEFSRLDYSIDEESGQRTITGGKIKIKGHSICYEIANDLSRLTKYGKDFFRLYKGKRTKRYYAVLFYLIGEIAWMRNPRSDRSNKITYSELYEKTGADTKKAKDQTKVMMYKIIDQVFIPTGHIIGYKEAPDGAGVEFQYTRASKPKKAKIAHK